MKKSYRVKEINKTKLKSYLDKKPKKTNNERNTRQRTSRTS
jgi:hypothetical protein